MGCPWITGLPQKPCRSYNKDKPDEDHPYINMFGSKRQDDHPFKGNLACPECCRNIRKQEHKHLIILAETVSPSDTLQSQLDTYEKKLDQKRDTRRKLHQNQE